MDEASDQHIPDKIRQDMIKRLENDLRWIERDREVAERYLDELIVKHGEIVFALNQLRKGDRDVDLSSI